ncbi:hypothetical protein [Marinomonas fungiae]|uniref:Lipoprotein n=1 Tax=Marinomonas fungiae TaxID=1137284 RepID=A0A0K6IQN1_9GAMM|nr:hypothetical protein [Marinomonas fungiae]CUB05597.1 Domain of unknown function (DUF4136) [Marinomonas fungiae]
MRAFLSVLLLLFVTGCSSNVVMMGRQVSNVDPDVKITPESRILVEAQKSADPLTNKRYLDQVVQSFKNKGYFYVGAKLSSPDFIARYHLTSQAQVRERQEPIYEERRTGRSTHCYEDKDGGRHCETDFHVMPYLVGYETVKRSVLEAVLDLELVNTNGKVVLHSSSSVEHSQCSRWKLYEFLIERSIKNLNVEQPQDQPYRIEMPEDYQCTDDL